MFRDYSKYTLEELYDIAKHVDRDAYPDRYEMIVEQIGIKEATNLEPGASTVPNQESTTDVKPPSILWPIVGSVILSLYLVYGLYSGELPSNSGAILVSESPGSFWTAIAILTLFLFYDLFLMYRAYKYRVGK